MRNWKCFQKYTSPSTLDRDVKAIEQSSFKFVTEDKRSDQKQIKGKLRRDCEDLGALVLRVEAAWCSDLQSIIDSFIKGRTNLRVGYNEGQSVSGSIYFPTTSLFPGAASLQSLYTLFGPRFKECIEEICTTRDTVFLAK